MKIEGVLGCNTHVDVDETAEKVLWGESLLLLDSLSESLVVSADTGILQGLSTPIISSLAGVGGAGRDPDANVMSTGATILIGVGLLMVDSCCSNCLMHWEGSIS